MVNIPTLLFIKTYYCFYPSVCSKSTTSLYLKDTSRMESVSILIVSYLASKGRITYPKTPNQTLLSQTVSIKSVSLLLVIACESIYLY